jgi:predicted dinucleotide-binding enzyme
VIERRRWRREEEAGVEAAVEETGLSGVDGGGVESGRDLESYGMKSKTTRGRLLFIGLKISTTVLKYNRY